MLLPYVELRHVDETIGYGTFATRFIPKGTITWVRDAFDQAFSPAAIETLHPLHRAILDKYSYSDASGDRILCWDHGRFVNHSCEPTCLAPGFQFEIAVRDILPGEQITDEYGTLNTDAFTCHCGQPRCRGVVQLDDILVYGEAWDEILSAAFPAVGNVPQPLWDLVKEKDEVAGVLAGLTPLPSCRLHALGARASDQRYERQPRAAESQMR